MTSLNIVFFENNRENFYPLSLTRAVSDFACGAFTTKERILNLLSANEENVYYPFLENFTQLYKETNSEIKINFPKGNALFINSALILPEFLVNFKSETDTSFYINGELAAFFVDSDRMKNLSDDVLIEDLIAVAEKDFTRLEVSGYLAKYLWNYVDKTGEILNFDFKHLLKPLLNGKIHSSAVIYGDKDKLYCEDGSEIHPHVVIDTKEGPVVIKEGAEIQPFSRIEGPAFIGKDSIILEAKVRSGTYIGEKCRIGGEVENSILLAHSNKYHEGFLGHSYLGEWVNLGALTTNSDLKNNYSDVDVILSSGKVNTKTNKAGCYIGDHSKTSIGCLFNTGSTIGVMANVVATGGLLPKYIPSFANFGNGKFLRSFPLSQLFETAKIVKSRRGKKFIEAEKSLYEGIYQNVQNELNKVKGKNK